MTMERAELNDLINISNSKVMLNDGRNIRIGHGS